MALKKVDGVPIKYRERYDWDEIVSTLKGDPGGWYVVAPGDKESCTNSKAASATAERMRKGVIPRVPPKDARAFEAYSRKDKVYARYIGREGEYK